MRPHRLLAALSVIPLVVSLTVSAPVPKGRPAGDWPQWRGPNRDGHSPAKGLLTKWPDGGPKLLWQVAEPTAVGVGYGSPVVADGRVFVLGADPPGGENRATDEYLTCLRARDGARQWRTPLGVSRESDSYGAGPASTPTVDGDRVYVLSSVGELVCLTVEKGEVKWRKHLVSDLGGISPSFGFAESPLVDGDRVVVAAGGRGGVVALEKATGKLVWRCAGFGDEDYGYGSAVVTDAGGVRQYVRAVDKLAVGIRAKDGQLLWKHGGEEATVGDMSPPVVADGFAFFTATGDKNGGSCFKLEKDGDGVKATAVYLRNKVLANYHSGVVAVGGKMYGFSETGSQWVCFDFKKGGNAPLWKAKGVGKGSVIAADGHLYCYGSKDGTCALVKPGEKEYAEVSQFKIPETSKLRPKDGGVFALPVVANGRLFLRDFEKLFAFDVSAR